MQLGSTCPRFDEYGNLYRYSVDVQAALCNYYAAVIRLCRYSVESSRKPGTNILFVPYNSGFPTIQAANAPWQLFKGVWKLSIFLLRRSSVHTNKTLKVFLKK